MKVYLVEQIDKDALELLKKHATITDKVEECDIILTRNLYVNKEMIDKAPNLKCIAAHGTGVSDIDIPYAKSKGITVFNAPYQNADSVAELNIMLTLMALRHAKQNSLNISDYRGLELKDKTVGILGYGHIGMATANIIKAFGANLLIYNRSPKDINITPINEVLAKSDIIILSMAVDNTNKHIINEDSIKLMKDGVILVNTARGALVNEVALKKALNSKKVACYASDVFEHEPLSIDDPILEENVIAYPHIGSNTTDALRRLGSLVVEQIIDFINGSTPKYKL